MKLKKGLKHQNEAVESIVNVLKKIEIIKQKSLTSNPLINIQSPLLSYNIKKVQDNNGICSNLRKYDELSNNYLNLDIKMETGTGKTFTQVKTIFELTGFSNLDLA